MFSVNQKRQIADAVQKILRDTRHPELPVGEISFALHVDGAESWSWADIRNNGAVTSPGVNPWNERQAATPETGDPTEADATAWLAAHDAQVRLKAANAERERVRETFADVLDSWPVLRPNGTAYDVTEWRGMVDLRRKDEIGPIATPETGDETHVRVP